MKGTRFYKIVIAILIIINIATLSFMWLRKPPHPPRPGEMPKLSNIIGVTGENKDKIDAIEKTHHIEKRALMRENRELHAQIFQQIGSEHTPVELQDKLDENRAIIGRITYQFFNEVSALCDENQKEELKDFIDNSLVNLMGGPLRGPKPRRHSN